MSEQPTKEEACRRAAEVIARLNVPKPVEQIRRPA